MLARLSLPVVLNKSCVCIILRRENSQKCIRKRERACVYVMYKLATARFCEDSFESIREKRLSNLLLEYEIPERTRNTKGDISVHKKNSQSQNNNNYINKLLLRESSIPTIHCRGRSNKNKRDQTPTKKSPALFLKRFSLFFFLFFFFFFF